MTAPTQVSDDQAKTAYLERCLKMSHGELYAELMRVHKEATALVQQAARAENVACCALINNYIEDMDKDYRELGYELIAKMEARHGLNS